MTLKPSYYYVHKFSWIMPMMNELYQGHPKPCGVYVGFPNPDTGNLFMNVQQDTPMNLVLFTQLHGENHNCLWEFSEITLNNILDLDIAEGDLDKLAKWLEPKPSTPPSAPPLSTPPSSHPIPYGGTLQRDTLPNDFHHCMDTLRTLHPVAFGTIWNIAEFMLDSMHDIESVEVNEIKMSKDHGLGANLAEVLSSLHTYVSPNRRESENPHDLMLAVKGIINELNRRKLHGI